MFYNGGDNDSTKKCQPQKMSTPKNVNKEKIPKNVNGLLNPKNVNKEKIPKNVNGLLNPKNVNIFKNQIFGILTFSSIPNPILASSK